jgi:hypothetical protein
MALTDYSGLTINNPSTGIQFTKVTDTSADWISVSNSTYFYDKADKLVHYKDSTGVVQEMFSAAGGITVGTTAVTSGTNTRVFFQELGVVQQDANFTFDSTLKRLTLKASGGTISDIPFVIQNSGGTGNLGYINGIGDVAFGTATITTGSGGEGQVVAIGAGAQVWSGFLGYPIAIGRNTRAGGGGISIGNGANSGTGQSTNNNIAIGTSATNDNSATNCIALGTSTTTGSVSNTIAIGSFVGFANYAAGGNIGIGHFFQGSAFETNAYAIGSGVSDVTRATLNIGNSFSVYFNNTQRSFFVNKNTNIVMRSVSALTAGTHYETAATNTLTIHNGTAPVTNIADAFQQYSADIVTGNAAPHFRTENGAIVKVYQETTGVGASTLVTGLGTPLTDTDTFDGYTLKQIVKALRNQGLLA